MEYNKNKNETGKCILFAPQDDDCMRKKNLFANLTAVISRMADLKETDLFKDFPGEVRFEKTDRGAEIVMPDKKKRGSIQVTDYNPYVNAELDRKTLEIISFYDTKIPDRLPDETILDIVKKSITIKRSEGGKYWEMSRPEYMCKADDLAACLMFMSRIGSGINVSKYNAASLNILLFYIRALSLAGGTGPVYEGDIRVKNADILTPASALFSEAKNNGKIYVKTEYADIFLPPEAKELAGTVLALAPDGPDADDEIKKSLDYHPCYTSKIGKNDMKKPAIEDDEIITDFSAWESIKKTCDDKVRQLKGTSAIQLALPDFGK